MYQRLIQPLLFRFDAERVHHFTFNVLKKLFRVPGAAAAFRAAFDYQHPSLEREVFGLRFKNPVGLAAGFDKNAELVDELACLGFGYVEIGTLTPRPQPGNELPRLFRLKPDRALINRMGFNNQGAEVAAARLRNRKGNILIGGNIGKNKTTPNEQAVDDYLSSFRTLFDVVDYFVVNVSSPNTPNLRELQEKEPLTRLLSALQEENRRYPAPKPILLKIAPDLTNSQLDDIIDIVRATGTAGVIATNTTIRRENADGTPLRTAAAAVAALGAGGLSGAPLRERATEVIRYLVEKSGRTFPVIGVGGIESPEDAAEKLRAGASLIQVYTGFIYEGPAVASRINRYLVETGV
jgi:dihydroorotate dehydrogenase